VLESNLKQTGQLLIKVRKLMMIKIHRYQTCSLAQVRPTVLCARYQLCVAVGKGSDCETLGVCYILHVHTMRR